MATACEGLRIIEVSTGMAGSMAGMVLADNGAEIIKVEPPNGDQTRTEPGFLVWNRGKKSIALDLKTASGQDQLATLIPHADALIQDLRPGTADRLGINYDQLVEINPGLIYVAISGWGEHGPLKNIPGYEHIVAAKTGRMSSQNFGFREGPIFTPTPIASYGAAMLGIQGMLAAIYNRETTGRGQRVNTSLFHALVAYDMSGFGRPSETPAAEGAVRAVLPLGFATPECSDGRFLQMCSRAPRLFRNWMRVMGLDHLYDDPAFHQMPDRIPSKKDMDMIYEHVHAKMLEKTPEEWIEIFLKEDVGGDPFLTPKELLRHPQTIANQRVIELDDPNVGKTVQIGPLANFSQTPAVIERSAPALGEHTEEIISTLSSTEPTRQFTPTGESSRRYPLEGVTVVDNAFFYAAPFGATLLAEMGARVIKIEPPAGDPTRRNTVNDYLKTMQGKESVVLDLKTEEGVSALYKIVEKADIFLHNFRPGVPESLKIDYETLSKINPRLVYVYGSCFGSQGPWSKRPGFHSSPNAMGGSGIVESGEGNPPKDRVYPDPAGALGVATAMMMGLRSRERTGKGQYVETTMINSSGFVMSHWSLDYANKPDDPVPDQGQHGYNALHRLYETKDGWLFVQTIKEREWQAFASSIGKPELLDDSRFATAEARSLNDGELANILAETLRERDASDWEIRLLADGVPAVRADNIDHHEFMINEAHALENNISIEDHLSTGERFYRHANCVEFPTMENQVLSPMPLGWATEPILREVGLSDQEIQSLHDRGVTVALGHGL